uniref:Uncharacterized protein n=1 Tax=Arundo donax TaxID=35708 RepID=A0A0A9B4D2_ARUDO
MAGSSERHIARDESTTSMDTSAPVMPPTPVPRTTPVSVASPISPPVIAPRSVPTVAKTQVTRPRTRLSAAQAAKEQTPRAAAAGARAGWCTAETVGA